MHLTLRSRISSNGPVHGLSYRTMSSYVRSVSWDQPVVAIFSSIRESYSMVKAGDFPVKASSP
ncbi:hypothetical protein V3C99_010372 [Haemonchus contortus]